MRFSFRLAELLGHAPDPRKRPGTIKAIVQATGLDRHQIASLLKNEVKYVPLNALSRLCDFLIEQGYASADQLPGALFAVEPEHFWELLARRQRLEICMGVRRPDQRDWTEGAWVVASDSLLMGELLHGVSTLGGAAKFVLPTEAAEAGFSSDTGPRSGIPHPEHIRQSLVWSPDQGSDLEVASRAREVYEAFSQSPHDKALLCLGSSKSNPVVELVLASAFDCNPFKSQHDVSAAVDRACPVFFRYRNDDPQAESCCGGLELSQSDHPEEPGIYFETADSTWAHAPWRESDRDAALVFYVHRESQGRLEMVLGGFSGRATRLLAKTLATEAEAFWPPIYSGQGIQVGVFVVQFSFNSDDHRERDILHTELIATTKVHRLDSEVIRRRVEG